MTLPAKDYVEIDMRGMTDEQTDAALVLAQRNRALTGVKQLRKQVAELEALTEAGAWAVEALEGIEQRSAELLREALDLYASAECVGATREERKRVDEMRVMVGLPPLDDWPRTPEALFRAFTELRTELVEADVCLSCGAHTPGRTCQCENDE